MLFEEFSSCKIWPFASVKGTYDTLKDILYHQQSVLLCFLNDVFIAHICSLHRNRLITTWLCVHIKNPCILAKKYFILK